MPRKPYKYWLAGQVFECVVLRLDYNTANAAS